MAAADWEISAWERLLGADPTDVCRRSLAVQSRPGVLDLPFLTVSYQVDCGAKTVMGPGGAPPAEVQLVLLNYLISASCVPPALKWVNERHLSGGELFFSGPHALPVDGLIGRFGRDREGFLRGGQRIGGEPMEFGDASLRLQPLPRVPLGCILWEEDDEFPARVSYLFEATTDQQLPVDVILGMVKCVGLELIAAAD